MSDGSEFQVCGAATENARRANSMKSIARTGWATHGRTQKLRKDVELYDQYGAMHSGSGG